MRRTFPLLFSCLGWAILLASCGKPQTSFLPLPTGQQTMTGVLLPAPLSTLRRGTHQLMEGGETLTFVESFTVNLRSFEGKRVMVRGTFEPNSDPSLLPVLVAKEVVTIGEDREASSSSSSSSTAQTGSGAIIGKPCGGTAGILCPPGEYCEISNFKENIGRCRKIRD